MALKLIVGNKNYSSWSFRPWIAMKVAGIPFEEKVISLDDGLSYATNQNNLLLQLKGLSSTEDYINQANDRPDTLPVIPHTPPPQSNMASVLDMME